MLRRLLSLDDGAAQLVALVLDDKDMEEAVAYETAERIVRPERPFDLKDNCDRHREAEEEHHQTAAAHRITAGKRLHQCKKGHYDVQNRQQEEYPVAERIGHVVAGRIETEKAAVETVGCEQHDEEGQYRVAKPGDHPRRPPAYVKVSRGKMAPHQDGHRDGDEEKHCVGIENSRPAKTGEHAPRGVRKVKGEYARQVAAVLAQAARSDVAAPDEHLEVGDQVDHHRQKGDYGIYIVLHCLVITF